MYLVDTNVVSELRKAKRAEPAVKAWSEQAPVSLVWLSTMSLLELEIGVLWMERRDARQGARLRAWLEILTLKQFEGRILDVDASVARVCATLHVPNPRPERDALIAATALVHGLTVVTRNTADFEPMGVPVLNPWLAAGT